MIAKKSAKFLKKPFAVKSFVLYLPCQTITKNNIMSVTLNNIQEATDLNELMDIARELKCNRRFAKLVREFIPVFSAREIPAHYNGVTFYTWMKQVANVHFANYASEFVSEEKAAQGWDTLTRFLAAQIGEEPETKEVEIIKEAKAEPKVEQTTKQDMEIQTTKSGDVYGGLSFTLPIAEIMQKAGEQMLPTLTKDLTRQIQEAAQELRPTMIKIGEAKEVTIEETMHKVFKQALTRLNINKLLMIQGPTGSGKTHLSEQLAKALDLPFGHISCTAGMSEAHITGRMTADGSFVSTEFIEAYENGGVFLFDEVDAADPNVLLLINSAIANGRLSVPNRKEKTYAVKHENFYLVCAANTWGHGSFEYSGREILDKAFLDRFNLSKVAVDYDQELELKLTKNHKVTSALQAMRKADINRSISTRTIIVAYRMSEVLSASEVFNDLTIDWTKEEIEKAKKHYVAAL